MITNEINYETVKYTVQIPKESILKALLKLIVIFEGFVHNFVTNHINNTS